MGFPGSAGKESTCNAGDLGLIPGLERSTGEGKGYPPQYSDLENSMDCRVHGVAKSWTRLSNFHSRWVIAKLSDCSFFKSEAIWKLCLGQIKLILLSCFAFLKKKKNKKQTNKKPSWSPVQCLMEKYWFLHAGLRFLGVGCSLKDCGSWLCETIQIAKMTYLISV